MVLREQRQIEKLKRRQQSDIEQMLLYEIRLQQVNEELFEMAANTALGTGHEALVHGAAPELSDGP